jgi:hypothetical protein
LNDLKTRQPEANIRQTSEEACFFVKAYPFVPARAEIRKEWRKLELFDECFKREDLKMKFIKEIGYDAGLHYETRERVEGKEKLP